MSSATTGLGVIQAAAHSAIIQVSLYCIVYLASMLGASTFFSCRQATNKQNPMFVQPYDDNWAVDTSGVESV